jgi:MFS transporter, DHA2 family, methylenomycin A resistance protein
VVSHCLQGLRGLSPLVTGAAFLSPSAPVWTLAGLMVLTGLAGPLVMPPVTAVLLDSIPGH